MEIIQVQCHRGRKNNVPHYADKQEVTNKRNQKKVKLEQLLHKQLKKINTVQ